MNRLVFFLGFMVFVSCSSGTNEASLNDENNTIKHFENFPEFPFLNLAWEEDFEITHNKLENHGFELIPSSFNHQNYFCEQLQIEFVFHEFKDKLVSFKVFMSATDDLEREAEILDLFSNYCSEHTNSSDFGVYTILSSHSEYRISCFRESTFLRIEFNLKQAH